MPITKEDLLKIMSPAISAGASGTNPYQQAEAQAPLEAARDAREAALRKYLQAREPDIARQKSQAEMDTDLAAIPRIQELAPGDAGVHAGKLGYTPDPAAKLAAAGIKGDEAARMKTNQIYNSGLPKIQSSIQAAIEGMDAINDPKNIGSLGQARTLMLKAMGMNRYNEKEAEAVLPPSLRGHVAALFNSAGNDMSPTNESQRHAVNQFFQGMLSHSSDQHKALVENALNTYAVSRYGNPQGQQLLKSTIGVPTTNRLDSYASKYKDVPATQGANLTSQPNPSILDKLGTLFQGRQNPAPQDQTPPVLKQYSSSRNQTRVSKDGGKTWEVLDGQQ